MDLGILERRGLSTGSKYRTFVAAAKKWGEEQAEFTFPLVGKHK